MKQPRRIVESKRCVSSTSGLVKVHRISNSVIARINEGYRFAYQSESREADRMSSIFFRHGKK